MATVFDGISRSYTLARAEVAASTDLGAAVPAVPAVTFRASLAVVTGGRVSALQDRYGADGQATFLIGECLQPETLPAGVGVGFQIPFTWGGQPGTLEIVEVLIDPFGDLLDDVVGQAFYARFRA